MSSESGTSFWPRVKEYIHNQDSAVEGPLRCPCPVCFEPLDIVGLPIDTAQDHQPAKVLPCGHLFCANCIDNLEASNYVRCSICRLPTKCQGCERRVSAALVPGRGRTVEAIDGVRKTTSEGGRHGSYCLTCVQPRVWRNLIRARRYPAAVGRLPYSFAPLVYNLMDMLEHEGTNPTRLNIYYEWRAMMDVNFDTLMRHTLWTLPIPLMALPPGFAPFFYGHLTHAQMTRGNRMLLYTFFDMFRELMDLYLDKLEQARDEYFADIIARFEPENMWFGDVEWFI